MNAPEPSDSISESFNPELHATSPRLVAFFLTQFHPIPENDTWWGKGFTEWTNVTKAKPLFDNHTQPHLPADLGFYDLRLRPTRQEQIRIAKQHGVDGFCYHYYWFSGKRLLEQPLDDMLADPDSDMPFCLCWANENWTRRWDAAEQEILIAQRYALEDDLGFIESLLPFFLDQRYLRIDGAPFLIVYRPQHLPDARRSVSIWREYCREVGIGEIHVCAALTHGNGDYEQFGFDSGVEFPPHNHQCVNVADRISFYEPFRGFVGEYNTLAQYYLESSYPGSNVFRTVFPGWDNTPRTGNRGVVVLNSTPDNYEYWLAETIKKTRQSYPGQERFVFINAWNEWAEGCYLEPDRQYGHKFLEATRRAKHGSSTLSGFATETGITQIPSAQRTVFGDLRGVVTYHSFRAFRNLATAVKRFPRLRRVLRRLFGRVA